MGTPQSYIMPSKEKVTYYMDYLPKNTKDETDEYLRKCKQNENGDGLYFIPPFPINDTYIVPLNKIQNKNAIKDLIYADKAIYIIFYNENYASATETEPVRNYILRKNPIDDLYHSTFLLVKGEKTLVELI